MKILITVSISTVHVHSAATTLEHSKLMSGTWFQVYEASTIHAHWNLLTFKTTKMKFIIQLTALAATFVFVNSAPTAVKVSDRVLVEFFKESTLKDCIGPFSIFSDNIDFDIPKEYTYTASVSVPLNLPSWTLSAFDANNGDVAGCQVFLTGAKSPINAADQQTGDLFYSLFPGSLAERCANGKCVKCADADI